jgi:hypothetical protein
MTAGVWLVLSEQVGSPVAAVDAPLPTLSNKFHIPTEHMETKPVVPSERLEQTQTFVFFEVLQTGNVVIPSKHQTNVRKMHLADCLMFFLCL